MPASSMIYGVLLCSASLRARHDLSQAQFSKGIPVARNVSAAKCDGGRKPLPLQGAEVPDALELRCNSLLHLGGKTHGRRIVPTVACSSYPQIVKCYSFNL